MMIPTSGWSTNCPRFRKRRTLAAGVEVCNGEGWGSVGLGAVNRRNAVAVRQHDTLLKPVVESL